MWKILNQFSKNKDEINEPNDDDFYYHFNELSYPQYKNYFSAGYLDNTIEFITNMSMESIHIAIIP